MKISRNISDGFSQQGWTSKELVVMLFVVLLALVIMVVPRLARWTPDPEMRRTVCVSNLKQIGLARFIFENDHPGPQPDSDSIVSIFQRGTDVLYRPHVLICPEDFRQSASNFTDLKATNISYFAAEWGSSTNASSIYAGDRNLTTNRIELTPGVAVFRAKNTLGWTSALHDDKGNIVMHDESVQQVKKMIIKEETRIIIP